MKSDALTVAIILFLVGVLLSATGLTKVFSAATKPPTALQQRADTG